MKLRLRFLRKAVYPLAFIIPPAVVGTILAVMAFGKVMHSQPQDFSDEGLKPPTHDATKPTVAILVSNAGTEVTDFLAPFEIFSTANIFNVYAVAPKRQISPFNGGVDVLPHFSLAEYDQRRVENEWPKLSKEAQNMNIEFNSAVLDDSFAAKGIVNFAQENKVDLIVMGNGDRKVDGTINTFSKGKRLY